MVPNILFDCKDGILAFLYLLGNEMKISLLIAIEVNFPQFPAMDIQCQKVIMTGSG